MSLSPSGSSGSWWPVSVVSSQLTVPIVIDMGWPCLGSDVCIPLNIRSSNGTHGSYTSSSCFAGSHAGPGGAQVVVNRQLETNPMVQLHTGDIVDIYYEKSASAPAAAPVPAGDQQSKDAKLVVMGLGSTMPLHRTLSGAGTADKSRARNNMVSASGILGRLTKTAHAGRAMQQKQQQ